MKKFSEKSPILILLTAILAFAMIAGFFSALPAANAATKTTMTRKGDAVWFGYYPQTKATEAELKKMSATPNAEGYYTSGKDKFVKVTNADPKAHSETADTEFIPFNDGSQPVIGATYFFKLEPIEWKVMVDDEEADAVKLVSRYYLDAHLWLSQYAKGGSWYQYFNTMDGVPEGVPANGWRYSEMRAWLNGEFLNAAFSEEEKASVYLFANTHTIDYVQDDDSTVVNDYIAIGDRSDYDAAGDDGRPTDYTIVKGATWCYNKDHIYYYVNDDFQNFPSNTLRLYRHDEHEKCASADSVEAVRPILYVKRGDAKILATASQKEEKQTNLLLISGIIAAVLGAVMAIPIMAITSARYKKLPAERKNGKFPYKKHEVPLIAVGLVLLIGGLCAIFIPIAINGGFAGLGGAKLKPGIYVQSWTDAPSGGVVSVGKTAYRLNADGTFNYTAVYEGGKAAWDNGGTWKQNGSKVTFVWKGNPMVAAGYTNSATIFDGGKSFGVDSQHKFKSNG